MGTGLLYQRIKDDIKSKIENGILKPGQAIGTENELREEYYASRVTIRHAIEELIAERVLEREFGKTAVVSRGVIPRDSNVISGLTEEMAKLGIGVRSFVLAMEEVDAGSEICKKMGVALDEPLMLIERLRYADGRLICYSVFYTLKELCNEIQTADLEKLSVYALLESKHGVSVMHATQEISAVCAGERMAILLKQKEGAPMLKVERLGYDGNGRCIEYSENYYIPDRYKLHMELRKQTNL